MNKYFILILIAVIVLGGGLVYRVFFLPESSTPLVSGKTITITITARKDEWKFEPETIEAEQGDKIIATVVNEDDYDHGIALDAFGISQRMPAKSTIVIEFVATQPGEYPFYCSVPCGEGEVAGMKRGHFDMIGALKVSRPVMRMDAAESNDAGDTDEQPPLKNDASTEASPQ